MSRTVNIHEAKTHLSRLLASVAAGEEVVIANHGSPVAKLVAITPGQARTPGRFTGQISGVDSLFEPLSTREAGRWQTGPSADPLRSTPRSRKTR